MYVLGPQERLKPVQSIFLIQVLQVPETYFRVTQIFSLANNEFSHVASPLG